jgi:ribosomal protein L31
MNVKCKNCGKEFKTKPSRVSDEKAKYCSLECCRAHCRGENHPLWIGSLANDETKHKRARRIYKLNLQCQDCGKEAVDRHHIDGDGGNNTPENIAFLCRRCHELRDGRLKAFLLEWRKKPQPPKICSVCGRPSKPLSNGRCKTCYEHKRVYGIERSSGIGFVAALRSLT